MLLRVKKMYSGMVVQNDLNPLEITEVVTTGMFNLLRPGDVLWYHETW